MGWRWAQGHTFMRRGMGFSSCSLQQQWARAGSAPPELLGAGRPKPAGPHSGHSQLDSKFPAEYLRQRTQVSKRDDERVNRSNELDRPFQRTLDRISRHVLGSTSAFSSSNSSGPSGGSKNHERLRIHDPYNSSHSLRVRLHRKLVMRIMQP
ncbi:hypothetical protein PCASD_07919 [Puccinia coronata f. sp. avenae]|uniref:Uncharacterized protein n=1 Tax=Puccinia coronata f. sp. avenae TaxID=200324 RepID=A0A2N5UQJ5_9BASI|nr:hypothetical protein PCASD_07919 [Puccinia coronata f. sp. avenae]